MEDLATEFQSQFGKKVHTVTRPYCFIEFGNFTFSFNLLAHTNFTKLLFVIKPFNLFSDAYIQKARKTVMDSRSRRNLSALNTELQDVQRIMVQNIDDVINRGAVLADMDTKAQNLSMLSQKYKKDATYLNWKSAYAKAAAGFVVVFVFILYFWVL